MIKSKNSCRGNTSILKVILPALFFSILIASSYGLAAYHASNINDKTVVGYLAGEVSTVVAYVPTPSYLLFSYERGDIVVASASLDRLYLLEHGTGYGTGYGAYHYVANVSLIGTPTALVWDMVDGNVYLGTAQGSIVQYDGDEYVIDGITSVPSPVALTYDIQHRLVYAVSNTSNSVYLINASATTIIKSISLCCTLSSIAYDSVSGYLYITESATNILAVINPGNGSLVANIAVGSDPQYVIEEGPYVYVANYGSNTISVINVQTNAVVETIGVGSEPDSIAFNTYNGCLYVSNYGSNDVSQICEGGVTATFNVGSEPDSVIYDPIEYSILVANYGSGSISEISTPEAPALPTTTAIVTTIDTQSSTSNSYVSTSNSTTISSSTASSSQNSSTTTENKSSGFPLAYTVTIAVVLVVFSEIGLLVYFERRQDL